MLNSLASVLTFFFRTMLDMQNHFRTVMRSVDIDVEEC